MQGKYNIYRSMSKFVSIETSFGPLLEHIKYPCLKQLYIVDVMKILPVFIQYFRADLKLEEGFVEPSDAPLDSDL